MWLLLVLACKPPVPEVEDAVDTGPEGEASSDWCDRITAGPPDARAPEVALSDLHARVRLFGPEPDFLTADAALAAAIRAGSATAPALTSYADGLADACVIEAEEGELDAAEVTMRGSMAWVRPGTGAVDIPGEAEAVVLDLRRLPAAAGLDEALRGALAASIGSDVALPVASTREWQGYVDQYYSESNVYTVGVAQLGGDVVAATGTERPLVVVTGRRMPREAARLAGALAQSGRAWIVGQDVFAMVAESRFGAVGEQGLAFKVEDLLGLDDVRWPDVIAPDVLTDDPEAELDGADLSTWAAPTAREGNSSRPRIATRDPYAEEPAETVDAADLAANLISVHGTVREFFPYFPVVGDTIDARLAEVLAEPLDPSDKLGFRRVLGRFGEALHDGHVFFGFSGDTTTWLPVCLDHVDGTPVVARSELPELRAGDTIVSVDGAPIADLYADLLSWHGAGTEGYALDLASRELLRLRGPVSGRVRDPDGNERDVSIDPTGIDSTGFSFLPIERPNGRLDDLGASDVAYINLDGAVTTSTTEFNAALTAAEGARGLVLDMRGYPGIDHYSVAQRLIGESFTSAVFRVNFLTADGTSVDESHYDLSPKSNPSWSGPLVLLVGPRTVSAAENFSMMLPPERLTAVVGHQSAGTNGNITGLWMPGKYYFSFTGMEVLFPDGSTFHGTGIVPTIEVVPTAADWRDGRDTVLEAAVAAIP